MTIRQKIRASSIATIFLVMVFIGVMLVLGSSLRTSYEKQQFSQKITETSFQLALLRSEYVLHPSERSKTQWISVHEASSRVLDEAAPLFSKTEEQALFEDTRKVSEDSRALFGQIIQSIEQEGSETVREELINQLTVKSQERVSNVLRLSELSRRDTNNALRFFEIILITLGVLFAVIYIASYFITTAIVASLQALGEDFIRISALDFSTTTTTTTTTGAKDEIGILQRAFNSMASKLKESYATLEQKVAERTTELTKKTSEIESSKKALLNVLQDLKIGEEKLIEAKAQDEAILFSIGDAVMACDTQGYIILFNAAAEALTGFSSQEVVGHHYSQALKFIRESDEETSDDFIAEAITTGQARKMLNHTLLVAKDGRKIPVADSAAPIHNTQGEIIGCVVVFRDVSHEREIDKAKSEFVSLASHQLRTPLSTINWYAEMLLAGDAGALAPEQRAYASEIYTSNQRMVGLVNALLDVSRIELGTFVIEPEPTDVVALLQDVVKETEPDIFKKKLGVEEKYAKGVPKLNVDPKLTRIIFQNLITNAVKYTPGNGRVVVKAERAGESVRISVADTGIGIPKDQQAKIFTKLFRADNVRAMDTTGTGLGLYLAKAIVDHTGGKIWFSSPSGSAVGGESSENPGTTFHVELPIAGIKAKGGTKRLGE